MVRQVVDPRGVDGVERQAAQGIGRRAVQLAERGLQERIEGAKVRIPADAVIYIRRWGPDRSERTRWRWIC